MIGEPADTHPSSEARASLRSELSIIVPCHNEAENVLELTERVQATFEPHGIAYELVLVNDASTDHTGALIDDLSRRYDFVRAVHHPANRGMTAGWASGLQASSGRYVVIMDGDLQNLPEDVYRLYRELRHSNADIVQGYRSHIGRVRDFRYTMSRD
jgi:phenylacetate-CoA ligase